jgi:hypothetical protein
MKMASDEQKIDNLMTREKEELAKLIIRKDRCIANLKNKIARMNGFLGRYPTIKRMWKDRNAKYLKETSKYEKGKSTIKRLREMNNDNSN